MNIIDNITPNEKRMCLFNVNEPTELPIEEFERIGGRWVICQW